MHISPFPLPSNYKVTKMTFIGIVHFLWALNVDSRLQQWPLPINTECNFVHSEIVQVYSLENSSIKYNVMTSSWSRFHCLAPLNNWPKITKRVFKVAFRFQEQGVRREREGQEKIAHSNLVLLCVHESCILTGQSFLSQHSNIGVTSECHLHCFSSFKVQIS